MFVDDISVFCVDALGSSHNAEVTKSIPSVDHPADFCPESEQLSLI